MAIDLFLLSATAPHRNLQRVAQHHPALSLLVSLPEYNHCGIIEKILGVVDVDIDRIESG